MTVEWMDGAPRGAVPVERYCQVCRRRLTRRLWLVWVQPGEGHLYDCGCGLNVPMRETLRTPVRHLPEHVRDWMRTRTMEYDPRASHNCYPLTWERVGATPVLSCAVEDGCNPSSHGGELTLETCDCGASRVTQSKGAQIEVGTWRMPLGAAHVHEWLRPALPVRDPLGPVLPAGRTAEGRFCELA